VIGAILGLLVGLILLIPGLCVMVEERGVWVVIALAIAALGAAIIVWVGRTAPPRMTVLRPARTRIGAKFS
jgi:hypothetical protein